MNRQVLPDGQQRLKLPGPICIWLIALILLPETLKRIGIWQPPVAEESEIHHFLWILAMNIVIRLPIVICFVLALWWVNRKKG